jgi:hypothetical protein
MKKVTCDKCGTYLHACKCRGEVARLRTSRDQWKSDCVELAGIAKPILELFRHQFMVYGEADGAQKLHDSIAKCEAVLERVKGDGY